MVYTQLSPISLPGKRYYFIAKTPGGNKGEGTFTSLSVSGLPGRRHTFLPKKKYVEFEPGIIGEDGCNYFSPNYFGKRITGEEAISGGGGIIIKDEELIRPNIIIKDIDFQKVDNNSQQNFIIVKNII